jgi:hypothetical protein
MKANARLLESISQWLMIVGIIALCQPWVEVAHRYGVTVTLIGLIGFSIFTKIPSPKQGEEP